MTVRDPDALSVDKGDREATTTLTPQPAQPPQRKRPRPTGRKPLEAPLEIPQIPGLRGHPGAIGPGAVDFDRTRQLVSAAMGFHIAGRIPGLDWARAGEPLVDRWMEMFGTDQTMVDALQQDINTLFSLDDIGIINRKRSGQPFHQNEDIFDAIAEVAWEVGAVELAAAVNATQTDAMRGTFDALTGSGSLMLAQNTADIELPKKYPGIGGELSNTTVRARSFQTLFDAPGAWSFSPTSGILAVTVGAQTVGVQARPGFRPETHLDVLGEVVAAQAQGRVLGEGLITGRQGPGAMDLLIGKAHELGRWVEANPDRRAFVDDLLDGVFAFNMEPAREQLQDEHNRITEESAKLAAVIPFPDDAMIATIGRMIYGDSGGMLDSETSLELAADFVTENRDQLLNDFQGMTQAELVEQLTAEIEGQSPFGRAVEDTLGSALNGLVWYDEFTQWIGLNAMNPLISSIQGFAAVAEGDTAEGYDLFQKAISGVPFGSTTAEWFGLEGTLGDAANLYVSIAYDPLNYVFVGARGVRGLARQALTHSRYAPLYLKMGSFPSFIRQVANATKRIAVGADDVARAAAADLSVSEGSLRLFRGHGRVEPPITTAHPEFDALTFASVDRESARLYGPQVDELVVKPDAKILREGTPEYQKIVEDATAAGYPQARPELGPSALDESAEVARRAKAEGYDLVMFRDQSSAGTAILNPDAVVPVARAATVPPVRTMTVQTYDALPDDALVEVYHITDRATAEQFIAEGVVGANKATPAVALFESGQAPPGLYVGSNPTHLGGYYARSTTGNPAQFVVVAVKVPKSSIVKPPEVAQAIKPRHILADLGDPRTGAVVLDDIPAGQVRIVGDSEAAKFAELEASEKASQAARRAAMDAETKGAPDAAALRVEADRLTAERDLLKAEFGDEATAAKDAADVVVLPSGRIVNGNQARAVRAVTASMTGMDDAQIEELIRLIFNPDSTGDDVADVLTRAMSVGDWLGEGPMRAQAHKTVEGLANAFETVLTKTNIPDDVVEDLMRLVMRLDVGRSFAIGEGQSLNGIADLLTVFYARDPDTYTRFFLEAVDARMARMADRQAILGAHQATLEQARRSMWEAGGTIKSVRGGADLRGVQQNIASIENSMAHLDELGLDDAARQQVRDDLIRMHDIMSRRVADADPKLRRARLKQRTARRQTSQVTYLEQDLANAIRNDAAAVVARIYDDVAQRINKKFGYEAIPEVPGKTNPLAPDVPVRNWANVARVTKQPAVDENKDLLLEMGLAWDDPKVARELNAVGWSNRSQRVLLPVSPYELTVFELIGDDQRMLLKWAGLLRRDLAKKASRTMKLVFAVNLLLNPITAGKITLDETLRMLASTGRGLKFLESTFTGLPFVGRPIQAGIQKWDSMRGLPVNPYQSTHIRHQGGFSADDYADYQWIDRPARRVSVNELSQAQYADQVERYINGTLVQDDIFQHWARYIDGADEWPVQQVTLPNGEVVQVTRKIPPPEFVAWWEYGDEVMRPGKTNARHTTIDISGTTKLGTELTAEEAFNIMDNAMNQWLNVAVDEESRVLMRRRLIEAGTTPGGALDRAADARLLKSVVRIPGMSGNTGFGSKIFNTFFGGPAGRRAGVFFEHYFDEAYQTLLARHGGRVLTVDRVMEATGADRETAEFWLRQGSDNAVIGQLLRDMGGRTEAQLQARAAVYAERRANDLMYQFTATSMAGRSAESALLFPFARAQVDFMSWWWDHLTKPMTVRVGLEQRLALSQAHPKILQAIQAVEQIPINLRAFAKYAHVVAMVNNENPSPLDQIVSSLTFLPMRYDSNFLISVMPQFGPLPSWLFDMMVDKGVVDEELEANIETLFPALAYTETESSWFEDIINRILPTSRRSLRDLVAGMFRSAYGLLGEDIHTNPDMLGQIVNMIADEKIPASTGDFQAASVAELLDESIWELVPGSEEWHQVIAETAVEAAAAANRAEWTQDMKDRVSPLAEYDAEYRALRSFDEFFNDQVFADLVTAGVWATNDLLVDDDTGLPRIQSVWERYEAGEATQAEMSWLDDRLHTAYFKASEIELLPNFTYMDYLHLRSPGLAVNLVNKSEDSGLPLRDTREHQIGSQRLTHAEFRQRYISGTLDGRLQNVPPGDEGRALIADARRLGWLVSRPVEEWAMDAGVASYRSAQRAIRGVWEDVTDRTWQAGLKKSIQGRTFTMSDRHALFLNAAGLTVAAGDTYNYKDFHEMLSDFDKQLRIAQPTVIDTLSRGIVFGKMNRHQDEVGAGLFEAIDKADAYFRDKGIDSIEDWPEETKADARAGFQEAVTLGYITEGEYAQEIQPLLGPLNYEPPDPPDVDQLEHGIRISGDDLNDLAVVDGDTVTIDLMDGPIRVRLLGINAPEVTHPSHGEARDMLLRVLDGASEVVLGIYKPEVFGFTQQSAPGEQRLLAWLYVDGVPLYDPTVFTADNPRGAGIGGNVVDLVAILEAGRR